MLVEDPNLSSDYANLLYYDAGWKELVVAVKYFSKVTNVFFISKSNFTIVVRPIRHPPLVANACKGVA